MSGGNNGKVLTVSRKLAKILTDSRKSHHPTPNLQFCTEDKLAALDRRFLLTSWVGRAMQEVSQNKEAIVRSFKKCGISLDLSGSDNNKINIEGIPDHKLDAIT